jgi:periplasmic protein TonB
MATRQKPYEQFGPFILFRKLESDALGDLWRAARIDGTEIGPMVAIRRLSGGRREALVENAHAVAQILPHLAGTSFVREQQVLIVDGSPCLVWEYGGGRSLRYIIDQSRGTKEAPASPLPLDQALVIAEKVALSLATMADLRDSHGQKLLHGALIPQFIWIIEGGEIRVAGQRLGAGILASLADPQVSSEIGRYFAPEHAQKPSDVYSMGAILFLLVTGQEPPDAATASAFGSAVRGARTTTGEAIPEDIRIIFDKSLNIDPSMRYPSMAEMKQAISGVAHSGRYSGSTFNLAFYLTTLLKKELEIEAAERLKESKVNMAAYAPAAVSPPVPTPAPVVPQRPEMFADALAESKPKKRLPLYIAAAALVVAAAAGGFVMMRKPAAPTVTAVTAAQIAAPSLPAVQSEARSELTATTSQEEIDTGAEQDPEAQKRAFEQAVREKLQAEMMKLQNAFMAELRAKEAAASTPAPPARSQPIAEQPAVQPAEDRATMTAAEFDQQRRESRQAAELTAPAVEQTATMPPSAPAQAAVTPPAQPVANSIRPGALVDAGTLDSVPRPLRPVRANYPAIAARQKISATIILTALISEEGEVLDVRVLLGDARFGLNDSAVRAIRGTRFSPPMKDGQRVRTWLPQTIEFNPN